MLSSWRYIATTITIVCSSAFCGAQQIPVTQARAIDKSVVTFPRSDNGKPLLLLISFSHKGEKQCDRWNERLKPAQMSDPRVFYYELADFQGVPSFVMRFVLHGIRRKIPKDEWSHFVPFYADEEAWKKLVNYSAPEDAYLVVADAAGRVLWQAHGAPTDQNYAELQLVIGKQVGQP